MPRSLFTIALTALIAVPTSASAQDPAQSFAVQSPFSFFGEGALHLDLHGAEPVVMHGLGVGLQYQLHPNLAVGVRSIGFGVSDSGAQTSARLQANPYVELAGFVDPHVQLFVQLGSTLAAGTESPFLGPYLDVWLSARAGVRFWLTDWLTIGVELGFDLQLTDQRAAWLPGRGAITPYVGLTVGFHF